MNHLNQANQAHQPADGTAWQTLIHKHHGQGRNIRVLKQHYPKWKQLERDHIGNFYLCTIYRAVYSLNAEASGQAGKVQELKFDGGKLNYQMDAQGDINLFGFMIDASYKPTNSTPQATGVYQVVKDSKGWQTKAEKQIAMDLNHQWNGAHYAAVAGKYDSKEDAGEMLIDHLKGSFKEGVNESNDNHYSLYWQEGKHQSDLHSNEIASLIQQAQAQKAKVNWLVQGEGAGTFVKALKVMSTYPSLSRYQADDGIIVRQLRKDTVHQKVFFSNPRGSQTSEQSLKSWCEKAGVSFYGVNINKFDLHNEDARKDLMKTIKPLLGKGIIAGPVAAVGLKTLEKSVMNATASTLLLEAGLMLLGGYLVGQDMWSKYSGYARNMPKGWNNTIGSGNQAWAEQFKP